MKPSHAAALFALWWMGALAQSAEVPAPLPTVSAVELVLPPGSNPALLKAEEARGLVAVRKGQRLSLKAVRKSIERLIATGRFSDVVVRALDSPEGTRVIFELGPKRFIAAVGVAGALPLPREEVLSAAKLKKGAEYYPEKAEEAKEAVVEALRRRGYRSARAEVRLEEVEGGLEVELSVVKGEPTRIFGITVAGSPGLPLGRVLSATGLSVGAVMDLSAAEAGTERLRELYRSEGFFRARVGEPQAQEEDGTALLVLPVSAGPQYRIHLHGSRSFPDQLLKGVIGYDASETLDRAVMARLARRLEAFYRFKGYHDVRAAAREIRSPDDLRAVLLFEVDEGQPLFVREVAFSGNRAIPSEQLRAVLAEVVRGMEPRHPGASHATDDPLELEGRVPSGYRAHAPEPDPATVLVEPAYRRAAEAMTDTYRERGFLSARVRLSHAAVDVERKTATVAFLVEEGPRAVVREVTYVGLPEGFDVRDFREVRAAEPLSYSAVERQRAALSQGLGRRGYLFAEVLPDVGVSESGADGRVTFRVDAGPQVRVGKVVVKGLARTVESVVREAMPLREGDVLDPERLFESQQGLVQLGIFRSVSVRPIAPERVEPVKDVEVELRELPLVSGEIGGGYFLAEGPRLVVDGVMPNLAGRAINLSSRLKIHYIGGSAQAVAGQIETSDLEGIDLFGGRFIFSGQGRGLWFLPRALVTRVDLVAERVHKPFFRFTRFAAVPGLELPITFEVPREVDLGLLRIPQNPQARLSLSLQYEPEHVRLSPVPGVGQLLPTLTSADQARLRFGFGEFSLHSLRLTPALDLRDSAVSPRAGLLLSASAEWMRDILTTLDDPINTLKASATLSVYRELAPSWVVAISVRGGRFFSLEPSSVTIPSKRFYLGGAATMRGFREEGLIPADRRADLARETSACTALANPLGCTLAARALLEGRELPSPGGEVFALSKAELRLPALWQDFEIGVFFEAGNLWLDPEGVNLAELRYVAGTGLRYVTPIGPMALDLGANLAPDYRVNEPTFSLHFNIGLF
ncbi:MAG: BamA/TamA family outer membrane protein [Myxococcales bacterium]|nr:BamA/TamA family outer membrane protein [Myxococcales bacterium]